MKIRIINGANLNMLGYRNQEIYGKTTIQDLERLIKNFCVENKVECDFILTNYEGEIIEAIQDAYFKKYDGIIINPGAFTHYSIAIRDALEILTCIKIEVHLSDIYNREEFRKISVISPVCDKTITGLGTDGYIEALKFVLENNKR